MTIGLRYSPNCFQVIISSSSSNVPQPPGNATIPSLRFAIFCFRSCMDSTSISSVNPVWCQFCSTIKRGITPVTSPPFFNTASATAHIKPILPAPLIRRMWCSASKLPNSSAALKYTGFILVLEALYTHTECIWFIATILLYHPAKLRKKTKAATSFPRKGKWNCGSYQISQARFQTIYRPKAALILST